MSDSKNEVTIVNGTHTAVIKPCPGFTVPQVLALMNNREARIEGSDINSYPEMGEGFTTVAKVFTHSTGARLGDGWKLDTGTADDTTQFPEPDEAPLSDKGALPCAGGCCTVTPEQRDRNFANSIRVRASDFARAGNYDAATTLIAAAWALLDNSGGRDNEPAIWLLAGEAHILESKNERLDLVEQKLHQALDLSLKLFGESHPCTAVCVGNVGEFLAKVGRKSEAREYLTRAINLLSTATPVGDYTAEYLSAVRQEIAAIAL